MWCIAVMLAGSLGQAMAAVPTIRAVDQQGARVLAGDVGQPGPVIRVVSGRDEEGGSDWERLLEEGLTDELRAWLLRRGEADDAMFGPSRDPFEGLGENLVASVEKHAPGLLATPLDPTATVVASPVIRGTLGMPVPTARNEVLRLPMPVGKGFCAWPLPCVGKQVGPLVPSERARRYAQTTPLNFKAYAKEIELVATRLGLDPMLLRAVMHAESAFNPKARSHAGAQGLMQLMPATARRFGASDAYEVMQNIWAGGRYLRWLLDRFNGNLALTAAAYNAGEGAVERYGGIPPYRETTDYVEKVLTLWQRYRAEAEGGSP